MGLLPSFRLRLTALWPALAALASAACLLWLMLPGLLERSAAQQLLSALQILTPIVARDTDLEGRRLQERLVDLASDSSLRLTLIAADGRVLADTSRSFREMLAMEHHGDREEVREALARGEAFAVRRSDTTGRNYVYASRTFRGEDGRQYVLRLAQPLEQLSLFHRRLVEAMVVAAVIGLLAMGLVSWRLDHRFFRPLTALIDGAANLPAGGHRSRLAIPRQSDLAHLAKVLNRLSDRVTEQLADLEKERDQLKAILQSMDEGILLTDAAGRAMLANAAFRRIFGIEDRLLPGLSALEICRQPELAQVIEEVLSGAANPAPERRLELPGGSAVALTATALAGSGGAVAVARDVTDEDRIMAMRRDFVANVSHELKTPLTAIRGYAETMLDGALDDRPAAERFIDRILVQCHRLQHLLQDLLTLSRLESPDYLPAPEPVNLSNLASRAVEVVSSQASAKNVQLHLDTREVPRVLGIPDDLERLLLNLLENAVKYNRAEGHVTVRTASANGHVVLEVEDTGIGIPADAQPRLFERFYRVDKGRSRAEGGTGLGLSIVKHVAQAHGGDVEVRSTLGKGSTFRVRLPVAPAS